MEGAVRVRTGASKTEHGGEMKTEHCAAQLRTEHPQLKVVSTDVDRRVQSIDTYTLTSTEQVPIREGPDRVEGK